MHVAVTFYEVPSVTLCRFNANCFRCLEFTTELPTLLFAAMTYYLVFQHDFGPNRHVFTWVSVFIANYVEA